MAKNTEATRALPYREIILERLSLQGERYGSTASRYGANVARDKAIWIARMDGATLEKAGKPHGISRERTRQILVQSLRRAFGGRHHPLYRHIISDMPKPEIVTFPGTRQAVPKSYAVQIITEESKVGDLQLSVRVSNCLKNDGLVTVADVLKLTPHELLSIPNFGRKCMMELDAVLKGHGFALKPEQPIIAA